jgi:hypothetical protein
MEGPAYLYLKFVTFFPRDTWMYPEALKPPTGKDAKDFLEYDRRPLTEEEIASLERADEVYSKIKPRR